MRFIALVMCAAVTLAGCGGKTAPALPDLSGPLAAAGPLINSIGSAVPGLSQAQSILGAGSLLGLAKGKMRPSQYAQVSSAMPGSDALIAEATNHGLPSQLDRLSDVAAFLGKSGISPSQLNGIVPAMGNALTGKVSPDVATAFMSALR